MVIVLVRRCVKRDKETEFLESYRQQKPTDNADFLDEELTKVVTSETLPEPMRSLPLACDGDCVTYVNVARWKTAEAFRNHFDPRTYHDPAIECSDRLRVVLELV
jgi:hypothetical protein